MNISPVIEEHIADIHSLIESDFGLINSIEMGNDFYSLKFKRSSGNGIRLLNCCQIRCSSGKDYWLYKSVIIVYPTLSNLLPILYAVSTYYPDKVHLKMEYAVTSGLSLKTGFTNGEQSFDGFIDNSYRHNEILSEEIKKYLFNNRFYDNDPLILSFNREAQLKFVNDKLNSDELKEVSCLSFHSKPLLDLREHLFFPKDQLIN